MKPTIFLISSLSLSLCLLLLGQSESNQMCWQICHDNPLKTSVSDKQLVSELEKCKCFDKFKMWSCEFALKTDCKQFKQGVEDCLLAKNSCTKKPQQNDNQCWKVCYDNPSIKEVTDDKVKQKIKKCKCFYRFKMLGCSYVDKTDCQGFRIGKARCFIAKKNCRLSQDSNHGQKKKKEVDCQKEVDGKKKLLANVVRKLKYIQNVNSQLKSQLKIVLNTNSEYVSSQIRDLKEQIRDIEYISKNSNQKLDGVKLGQYQARIRELQKQQKSIDNDQRIMELSKDQKHRGVVKKYLSNRKIVLEDQIKQIDEQIRKGLVDTGYKERLSQISNLSTLIGKLIQNNDRKDVLDKRELEIQNQIRLAEQQKMVQDDQSRNTGNNKQINKSVRSVDSSKKSSQSVYSIDHIHRQLKKLETEIGDLFQKESKQKNQKNQKK